MKIRASFVANSSSSSFLLWGVDRSEFRKIVSEDESVSEKAEELGLMYMGDAECVGVDIIYDDYGTLTGDELAYKLNSAKEKMAKLGFSDCKFYYGVQY